MEEVHQGICSPHMNKRILAKKILRVGSYWNMIEIDCVGYVKSCHDCQTHANLNHVPPSELYSMTSPWPFSVWRVMKEYIIEHHKSSPYRPQDDGAIEATNKNVKNILAKMVVLYKDWSEMLPFGLWVIELLSVRRLGQHLTLWFMLVRRCFLLRWRYNL